MEFLDPKKQKAHLIRLIIGYILMGIALILTTIVLLYQANGWGIKNGEVIQNGLVFISSRPNPADIFINGQPQKETTNTRLLMLGGQYTFEVRRDGYRPWKRAINVEGGAVVRFDYPMLFPSKLSSAAVKRYASQPPTTSQSPDRRWLLVKDAEAAGSFDLFDLDNPEQAPRQVAIPASLLALEGEQHRWKAVEWADNNRHLLLQHATGTGQAAATEYIVFDREAPERSVNLTATLGGVAADISLRNKKFDQYYLHDKNEQVLSTASLEAPEPRQVLDQVLGFKAYGEGTILYATAKGAPESAALVRLLDEDGRTYTIRQAALGSAYMLNLARYDGAWYVVAGVPSEGRTYVYRNPVEDLQARPKDPLVPVQVLKTPNTQHVAFSDNARFIMGQGGQQFALYDAENDRGYAYTQPLPMDAPQPHVTWMDGHRLMMVSGGKVVVFDFDKANQEVLVAADPAFVPVFDRDYRTLYTFSRQNAKAEDGTAITNHVLSSTPLLTPADR